MSFEGRRVCIFQVPMVVIMLLYRTLIDTHWGHIWKAFLQLKLQLF